MTLYEQIFTELNNSKKRINDVEYGKIVFIVQDGKLMRIDITESRPTKVGRRT